MSRRARAILLAVGLLLLAVAMAAVWAWQTLFVDLPSLDQLTQNLAVPSTRILARDGRLLYEIADPAGNHHATLPLKEIPLALQQATIATEDASFYTNPGVDLVGIVRAVWINLRGGNVVAGGSTITQQVARNMLLDPQERAQRTLTRKLRETILAWRLAQTYSKDAILELYLNQTSYGHLAFGVESAAQTYFGKSARDLDLAEAALLAGLPQAPSAYDPLLYLDAAKARQRVVLDLMVKQGYLTADAARQAKDEAPQFAASAFPIEAPHFVFYVWNWLEQTYPPDVLYSGLVVTTTLDLDLTHAAQAIALRRLKELSNDQTGQAHNATNAALVALDPRTGQVLAMLGSPDYFKGDISGSVNMAVTPRQPGSAIKPVTYAAAFSPALCPQVQAHKPQVADSQCPWTAATSILDVRTAFVTKEGFSYVPMNYDRAYHGPVSARAALAGSLNLPAVLTLDHVGISTMLGLANRMGLTTLSDASQYGLALTLGGGAVRLLDLAAAYAVFANGGRQVDPVMILQVRQANGTVLLQWTPPPAGTPKGEPLVDERVAYLITDILADNNARAATFGFNSILRIGRPAAVKTGTTTDYRDNWTVGYTPELVTGVWVGNADNSAMLNLSGVAGAGPIWHDFMRQALSGKPETWFTQPPGMVRAEVCVPSGLLPTPACPATRSELFLDGTVPAQPDNLYRAFEIDTRTGQLADANTPPAAVQSRVFLVLPPAAQQWGKENGLPQPPAAPAQTSGSALNVGIASPDPRTIYQITPRLPIASQQIPFRVVVSRPPVEVTFILDGQPLAPVTAEPFEVWWSLQPGVHTLSAEVRWPAGDTAQSETVQFTVNP
jgi:penicillin-binding protein 1C